MLARRRITRLAAASVLASALLFAAASPSIARVPHAPIAGRPDLLIGTFGDDIYDGTGASEVKKIRIRAGHAANVYVDFQNDGPDSDSFTFTGGGNVKPFSVHFLNGNDITTEMESGTYSIGPIAATGTSTVLVQIKASNKATPKTRAKFKVYVVSNSLSIYNDAVIISVRGK